MMAWIWFALFVTTALKLAGALIRIQALEERLKSREGELSTPPTRAGVRSPTRARSKVEAATIDARWPSDVAGEFASFTYTDADGVVTDRQVRNWNSSGAHVKGYCLVARGSRTFRKDRIEDWVAHGI